MSRATVDLQAIRFFLGLIFVTQTMLTIVLTAAVMIYLGKRSEPEVSP